MEGPECSTAAFCSVSVTSGAIRDSRAFDRHLPRVIIAVRSIGSRQRHLSFRSAPGAHWLRPVAATSARIRRVVSPTQRIGGCRVSVVPPGGDLHPTSTMLTAVWRSSCCRLGRARDKDAMSGQRPVRRRAAHPVERGTTSIHERSSLRRAHAGRSRPAAGALALATRSEPGSCDWPSTAWSCLATTRPARRWGGWSAMPVGAQGTRV